LLPPPKVDSNRSKLPAQNQHSDHHKRRAGHTLNPINRKNGLKQFQSPRQWLETATRATEALRNFPRPFLLCGHGHRGDLSLVAQLSQKKNSKVVNATRQSIGTPFSRTFV
jgi:hypothetical protein